MVVGEEIVEICAQGTVLLDEVAHDVVQVVEVHVLWCLGNPGFGLRILHWLRLWHLLRLLRVLMIVMFVLIGWLAAFLFT